MSRALSPLLAVLFFLASCTSVARKEHLDEKEQRWKTIEVEAPSDRMLWQLLLLSVQGQGYPLAAGSDLGSRKIESGWKIDMQPFRGDGTRRRAIVNLTPLEPGRWKLEARVHVEKNQNLVSPLDPVRAEWKGTADDEIGAQVILQQVRARLSPALEVQPAKPKAN